MRWILMGIFPHQTVLVLILDMIVWNGVKIVRSFLNFQKLKMPHQVLTLKMMRTRLIDLTSAILMNWMSIKIYQLVYHPNYWWIGRASKYISWPVCLLIGGLDGHWCMYQVAYPSLPGDLFVDNLDNCNDLWNSPHACDRNSLCQKPCQELKLKITRTRLM